MTQSMPYRMTRACLVVAAIACIAGCAGTSATRKEPVNPDPFERFNRVMYDINDLGDRYLARPVAQAYEAGTPTIFRIGANNFLENLSYPITIVNDFLQGKVAQGGRDLARFAINSTIGLFGLFDPASAAGLEIHDEDFGQTFAVWGLPQGPYLVVPVFGPYTVSSAVDDLAGTQLSLIIQKPDDTGVRNALMIWYLVHRRYSLLPADEQLRQAFDPYIFLRDAYLQNRRYKIYDGNPPLEDLYPEDEDDAAD